MSPIRRFRESRSRQGSRPPSWRGNRPRSRSRPWCRCWGRTRGRSNSRCRSWRRSSCRGSCRCGRWRDRRCRLGSLSARKHPDLVYIFFVLVSLRVEVKCCRVRYVTAGFVGIDGDIVAYLALIWIPFERIKRIAHCHVRRPSNASIGAPGIE